MCGRFTLTRADPKQLAAGLLAELSEENAAILRPRYNVAPTDLHLILRAEEEKRVLVPARWGLVNHWAKDAKRAAQQINARAESAATKPAFRSAFKSHRCGVPADGWFEWTGPEKKKQPIWFHLPEGEVFCFAGLQESWEDPKKPEAGRIRTFTILTTDAKGRPANFHDRMPVILEPRAIDRWLRDPIEGTPKEFIASVSWKDPEAWVGDEVSRRVNSVRFDDAACLAPPGPMDDVPKGKTGSLF